MTSPESPSSRRRIGWALVGGQFALIAALVLAPPRSDWPVGTAVRVSGAAMTAAGLAGMAVAGLGLDRGLTASPVPNRAARLRTGGLYAWVRHPIYTALLLFGLGRVIVAGSAVRAAVLLALVALLTGKARWEERLLAERFDDYAATVPRFVPRLRHRAR